MAKHEITVYQNTGATKTMAPYIGSYISKETLRLESFKAKIAERCGLPAIQVQAILTGAFDEIEALEKESLVRVHLDGLTVCGIITGSFPTADAAFNKDKNALQLAVRLGEPIRNALADVTPTIITDASLTKLRVDNVMDLEAPRPFNVIHGRHVFRVAGFNMVLGDEGAEAFLENPRGTKFPLVIDEVVSKQLFKAHTETLLEPGDYKLVVKSKAGDAEGPLQTDYRRVKYLEVADPPKATLRFYPTATEAKEGGEGLAEVNRDDNQFVYLAAAGAEIADGDTFAATLTPNGGGAPLTTTVTVERSESTGDAAFITLPFCEPEYVSIYGTLAFENDSIKGEIPMVPKE